VTFPARELVHELTVQKGFHICFISRRSNLLIRLLIKRFAAKENLPRLSVFHDPDDVSADSELVVLRTNSFFIPSPLQAREEREELEARIDKLPAKTALVPVSLFAGKGPKPFRLFMESFSLPILSELWSLMIILYYRRELELDFGDPIILTSQRREDLNRASRALYKSEKLRRGAAEHSNERVERMILSGSEFESLLSGLSDSELLSYSELRERAAEILRKMQGRTSGPVIAFFSRFLTPLVNRIFQGIEVTGVESLRQTIAREPVVLLPNHRSHFDYLLLSFVLYRENLPLPYIAAGDNLNFFPAGALLRRAGGFFIRRKSDRDPLYRFVLQGYITYLMKQGHLIAFFVEGGRSRSGLPRQPKIGLLKYIVSAVKEGERKEVSLIPVSITYDRVPEERSITAELSGEKKKRESFMELLRAADIFRRKFGSLNVAFGERVCSTTSGDLHPLAVNLVRQQAELGKVTPLSFVAAARSIASEDSLISQAQDLYDAIVSLYSEPPWNVAMTWCTAGKTTKEAVDAVFRFTAGQHPGFPENSAVQEYYKNQFLGIFYPKAVVKLLSLTSQRERILECFENLSPIPPIMEVEYAESGFPPVLLQFLKEPLLTGLNALELTFQGEDDVESESLLVELRTQHHAGFTHYSEAVQLLLKSWRVLERRERIALKQEIERLLAQYF
jgi:1-acyl-sn-glycerol-3-phosphate acyltransferase